MKGGGIGFAEKMFERHGFSIDRAPVTKGPFDFIASSNGKTNWGTIADIWQEKQTDVEEAQGIDEEATEQQKKDASDYGDYLCHVQKDRQAMSSANTDSEIDDEELPF